MNINSLSAGSGPAAAILIGGLLIFMNQPIGWLMIVAGLGLSLFWALKFR